MARYKVNLAYDGTNFMGFQRQAKSARSRTVQQSVETALSRLGWQGKSILAAGRTDTGVHATGQVVAFDLEWPHSTEELLSALNAYLPQDIAAQAIEKVEAGFHPRYDAIARRYRYFLFCQPLRHPLRERYAWRVWPEVRFEMVQEAAQLLVGTHDFAAFGQPPGARGATLRQVFLAQWEHEADRFAFEIVANAFLYRMVRRLVFCQVEIAQGKRPMELMTNSLRNVAIPMTKGLAPPQGLTLTEVIYSPLELARITNLNIEVIGEMEQ